MKKLTLGYSPCPNDTFIFYAMAEKKIELPFEPDILLADVEMLNRRAAKTNLDISKISASAALTILDQYWLLRAGGAMGRGCGPLIVSARPASIKDLRDAMIATPGELTTASLLLRLEGTHRGNRVPMQFDQIMPAVVSGTVDAGVIIHEGRWTFKAYGLHEVLDLGRWWEKDTALPLPLGAIAMRRDLGREMAATVEEKIRESLAFSLKDPAAAWPYIQSHAQEMSSEVIGLHIDAFVNEFSLDVGVEGEKAMRTLLKAACDLENSPFPKQDLFWS
ncbi:MAG: 1,4-dihydroxy-6-naphthoate synthase [Syntrophobacteraceae bacterium]|nr:1,4-dihydroxy-6-naphthoate synthase [Syntrophobacteraceae bacterium]